MKQREADSSGEPAYKMNVLERVVAVLHAFSMERPSLTLAEISRATGLHRSTALRFLSNLTHSGLVVRDEADGRYSLGYEIIAMADIARAGTGISDWARPVMRAMREEMNETVILSVRSGDFRVDVDQAVANQAIRRVVSLGEHKPLTIGAPSLSILSGLAEDEIEGIAGRLDQVTRARYPDFDLAGLFERLERLRADGFCEHMSHHDGEGRPGSAGVAAPVVGKRGEIVAAIGASVPIGRYGDDERARIIEVVKNGAVETSNRLGRRSERAA